MPENLNNNLPDGVLAAVRDRLNITWADEITDRNLTEIILQGIAYLNHIAGEDLDYTIAGSPGRTLLFEYARYVRDNALEVFENNYQTLLLALQNECQITRKIAADALLNPGE